MRLIPIFALVLAGCPQKTPPTESVKETSGETTEQPAAPAGPTLMLDGQRIQADWDDGDTFSTPNPAGGKRLRARMKGYNTLESYGPVHRWGEWTGAELYANAKQAGVRASSEVWTCTTLEGGGGYGRILVDCPDLRRALVSEGLAHVFAIDDEPDPGDVAAQQQAIAAGAGMWAKGAPEQLITSLHSLDERDDQKQTYNRVADLKTGKASKHEHADTYTSCQEVCIGGSCMTYVPYANRYKPETKAECLK